MTFDSVISQQDVFYLPGKPGHLFTKQSRGSSTAVAVAVVKKRYQASVSGGVRVQLNGAQQVVAIGKVGEEVVKKTSARRQYAPTKGHIKLRQV